jgi:TetR/AcrR family transcriptional repressor of uid operon
MRRTDKDNTDERRQQLVQAAVVSFNKLGLHGASIGAICKQAGMSPGHLYYYFENKDALVQAVFVNDWELGKLYLDKLTDTPDGLAIYLDLAPAPSVDLREEVSANLAFVLEVLAEVSRNPAIAKINKAHRRQYLDRLGVMVASARVRGELVAGADDGVVVQAVDMIATVRTVARAARRYDVDSYRATARALLSSLIKLPLQR